SRSRRPRRPGYLQEWAPPAHVRTDRLLLGRAAVLRQLGARCLPGGKARGSPRSVAPRLPDRRPQPGVRLLALPGRLRHQRRRTVGPKPNLRAQRRTGGPCRVRRSLVSPAATETPGAGRDEPPAGIT